MDRLVLQAVEEIALEGPAGCTLQQLWKLLASNLPAEVRDLTAPLKKLVLSALRARPDVEVKSTTVGTASAGTSAEAASSPQPNTQAEHEPEEDADSGITLVASSQARDMALGVYDQDVVHPLNDEMRRALELTGKSRKKGAVQSELARICNVPHKNFFIIVKTLETHSLVVRNNIQIRGDGGRVQTSILHLTRFAPDLAPGLKFAKTSAGDKSLYAVTDDEATITMLIKRMREMDPEGNGIVRSEFKRFVLRSMHTGNVRQNHRLWRRLQTKMVKQGLLELSVTEVQGSIRTVITAIKPEKNAQDQVDQDDAAAGHTGDLMAERSFAREFFHLVLNAGEEGIFMNDLGKHLQFPTRTFHKPSYLQDFLQRLGLIFTKEQKGKAVVVCVRAPAPLLATYRQTHAPEGQWLQHGWLNAVYDAMDAGPPLYDPSQDLAHPAAPLLSATPAEPASAPGLAALLQAPAAPAAAQAATAAASASPGAAANTASQDEDLAELDSSSALAQMPQIPARSTTPAAGPPQSPHTRQGLAQTQPQAQSEDQAEPQTEVASGVDEGRRQAIEAEVQGLAWVQNMSRLSQDRVRRLMLDLEAAGFLFRSNMRKFFRDTDPPEVTGNGPDTKTIDRYMAQLEQSGKLQRLSIPVTLGTSAMTAQDLVAYIKPEVKVDDALVTQLVEKWKVLNSARRSEGVIGYHQALRGRAPKKEEEGVPKPLPVRPSKLDDNIIKTGSDLLLKLYDNGYVRAKMIRIRLLHYWICKLLGLGGYERLAPGDEQAQPDEHVFTFRAAMPSSDHHKATAQLTSGAQSWASPFAMDAKQLLEWMPVEVFLQIVGTTKDVPHRLELTASGKRLRDLSEEERDALMDHRADIRTSQHMEILRCLGLIESVVVAPADSQHKECFSIAPTVASRYVAVTSGVIEVQRDKKRSTVSPSKQQTGKEEFERKKFDLATREGLESYWAQLAQMSVDYSKPNQGAAMRAWERPPWFPATTVPDILSRRAWNTLHIMTLEQSAKLKQAFEKAADESGYVSWVTCMHIAKDIGLEYEQVNALSNMRKAQLGRLGPVAQRPDNAKPRAMPLGRQLSMLPSELQAKHEAEIRANAAKRFAKQGISKGAIAHLVEEHIQKNRRVRDRADRKRRGLPPRRVRRKPSEMPQEESRADRKERRRHDQATRLDDGELGPGFMLRRPPRARSRAPTPSSAAGSDADEGYVPRLQYARGIKGPAHVFIMEEDSAILRAFARWRTHRSPEYFVNFRRFKLPVTLELAKRRFYKALSRYQQTQKLMEELQELCIDVYQRHHARKLERWQANQATAQEKKTGDSATAIAAEAPTSSAAPATQQAADPPAMQSSKPSLAPPDDASKMKRPQYLTEDKLAKLLHQSVATPTPPTLLQASSDTKQASPGSPNRPSGAVLSSPLSPTAESFRSPKATSRQLPPLSPTSPPGPAPIPGTSQPLGTLTPNPLSPLYSQSPGGTPASNQSLGTLTPLTPNPLSPLGGRGGPGSVLGSPLKARPLLDPFEPIFTVEDDEDEASLQMIEDILGLILDVTPRRPYSSHQGPRKRRSSEADGEPRKRRHSQVRSQEDEDDSSLLGGDAAASVLQGRGAAKTWKKMLPLPARGPLQLPHAKKPSVMEAHAMDLVKSLLYLGLPEHDVVAALSRRFTVAEMTAGLAFLQQQGLVNTSGVKRPLMLSKNFAEHMEIVEFPDQLPSEAVMARHQLGQVIKPDEATQEGEPRSFALSGGGEISGGLVCEILSLMAAGQLHLGLGSTLKEGASKVNPASISLVVTSPAHDSTTSVAQPSEPGLTQMGVVNSGAATASITSPGHQSPGPGQGSGPDVGVSPPKQQQQQRRSRGKRQQRHADHPERAGAPDRRPKQASGSEGNAPAVDAAALEAVTRHADKAGTAGLTKAQLAQEMREAEEERSSLDAAVDALVMDGTLQWAPAFDQQVLVSAGLLDRLTPSFEVSLVEDASPAQDFHSLAGLQAASSRRTRQSKANSRQANHADASQPAANSMQQQNESNGSNADAVTAMKGIATVTGQASSNGSEPRKQAGRPDASAEALLAVRKKASSQKAFSQLVSCPEGGRQAAQQAQETGKGTSARRASGPEPLLKAWTDDKGALNEPLWTAITQRALSVIMRNPGIPEDLLISQLQALNPQQAKALLAMMTAQGLLQQQATYEAAAAAVPAVFGLDLTGAVQVVQHYFVAAGASFGSLPQLSPNT